MAMSDMTARRLVVGLDGPVLTAAERAWLERWEPAGVILFGRNVTGPEQLRRLCRDLKAVLGRGAEIVADHEGGPVSVLAAAVGRPPAAATLGRVDDEDLTRRVHLDTGRRLVDLGIDRVLAPCCDVLSEPRNAVIGSRSFGAEAELVARHAAAATTGLLEAGVGTCLKHWPGHGGTRVDTHLGAVDGAVAVDSAPFAAALAAGADAVMVGHLPVSEDGTPASCDVAALTRLRSEMTGAAIWSDDVTMAALRPVLAAATGEEPMGEPGMVEPGSYPRSWLDAFPGAVDRLLIRGIPSMAFPVDEASGGIGEDIGPEAVPVPADTWLEARLRLVDASLPRTGALVWIDLTGDHRWGALAPDAPVRAGFTGSMTRCDPTGPEAAVPPATLLLVTSHRPITSAEARRISALHERAGSPPILLLGHPHLPAALRDAGVDGGVLSWGGDASDDDLGAWLRG